MIKKRALHIWLPAAVATVLYALFVKFYHNGFFYYVNDDLIIRDILSGRYSGVPDAHIYNIIYPFAWILKTLYQLFPTVDFWGLLMVCLPLVCLYAVLTRVAALRTPRSVRLCIAVLSMLAFHFMCGMGIVFFTFTYTAALCAATALFLFVTCKHEEKPFTQYIPSLILLLFSFCLRKDTMLMALPLFAAWGAFLLLRSKDVKRTLLHLLKPIGALALCVAVLFGSHLIAFSSPEWQDFLAFRDLRKSVHDFGYYPAYEDAKDLYTSAGLSEPEKNLVAMGTPSGVNTVFDTDADIRTVLDKVGGFVKYQRENKPFSELYSDAKERVLQYYHPLKEHPLTTWLTITDCVGALLIIAYALYTKKWWLAGITALGGIFVVAEVCSLAFMGRMTFPVLRAALALGLLWILGIALYLLRTDAADRSWQVRITPLFMCGAMLLTLGCVNTEKSIASVATSFEINTEKTRTLREYCTAHSDNIYFQPALIIATHTDNAALPFESTFNNLVVLGGWNAFSPEYVQSLQTGGLGDLTIEQALLKKDNAYIIATELHTTSIIEYFEWKYGERFSYTATPIPEFADTHNNNLLVYDFTLTD